MATEVVMIQHGSIAVMITTEYQLEETITLEEGIVVETIAVRDTGGGGRVDTIASLL